MSQRGLTLCDTIVLQIQLQIVRSLLHTSLCATGILIFSSSDTYRDKNRAKYLA